MNLETFGTFLTILDFEIGEVVQYQKPIKNDLVYISDTDKWIEIEEFISEKGHEPSTCEWMVHNGEPIKFYYNG